MAKKQKTFADKAKGKKKVDYTHVKYVKSSLSEKTGHWRFNEQMVRLEKGENLDAALKRMEEETHLIDDGLSEEPDETSEMKENGQKVESAEIIEEKKSEENPVHASTEDESSVESRVQSADDESLEDVESEEKEQIEAADKDSEEPADKPDKEPEPS